MPEKGLNTCHIMLTTMQLHTVASGLLLQPQGLYSLEEDEGKQNAFCDYFPPLPCLSVFLFFSLIFPRGHHFKMTFCGCEFLSVFSILLSLGANPLISCVSIDLQRTVFMCERKST